MPINLKNGTRVHESSESVVKPPVTIPSNGTMTYEEKNMKSDIWLKIAFVSGLIVAGLLSFSVVRALGTPTLERITDYQSFTINSYDPSISDDGRYVVYTSFPTGYETVILYDMQTAITTTVASGHTPAISGDGKFIAFGSGATDLVLTDTNAMDDIFVYNRLTRGISRVSIKSDGSQAVGGGSNFPSISRDGRYVAFESWADNLGGQGIVDVYVHDRFNGLTLLISQSTSGAPNYILARSPSISADGRFVAFKSDATNLVAGDNNNKSDIFLRDLAFNTTVRISEAWQGGDSDGASGTPVTSADGRYVAYTSLATNLVAGDANGYSDVFIFDRQIGKASLVSRGSDGAQGNASSGCDDSSFVVRCLGISTHGRFVSFPSMSTNFFSGYNTFDTYENVYLRDRQTIQTTLVSREYTSGTWGENGDDNSGASAMSGSGRFVIFQSNAWLMGVEGPGNADIFVYDLGAGVADLITVYLPLVRR